MKLIHINGDKYLRTGPGFCELFHPGPRRESPRRPSRLNECCIPDRSPSTLPGIS